MKGTIAFIVALCGIFSATSYAQDIENVRVKFEDGNIAVYYDLSGSDPSELYDFFLYGSHDNFQSPLLEVSGDVGQKLSPGEDKKIHWNARKEFGNFKGDINLKIKGGIHTPLLTYNGFTVKQKFKKSKPINITWTSSSNTKELQFEVLNEQSVINYTQQIENTGNYTWIIPKDFRVGKNYTIKISDRNNPLVYEVTDSFAISRRVPVVAKVAPLVLVGGTLLFISGGSDNGGSTSGDSNAIPDPPVNPQ